MRDDYEEPELIEFVAVPWIFHTIMVAAAYGVLSLAGDIWRVVSQ